MHNSELIRHYTLDRAGIMFVTDLIVLKFHSARMDVITTLTYLANGKNEKNATMQQ